MASSQNEPPSPALTPFMTSLIGEFAYNIVCEVQELKELTGTLDCPSVGQHPLVWFDDFDEFEYLIEFLTNSLRDQTHLDTMDKLYYYCISIPYQLVIQALSQQQCIITPTGFLNDCLPMNACVNDNTLPKCEFSIENAVRQLKNDIAVNIPTTVANLLQPISATISKKIETAVLGNVDKVEKPLYLCSTHVMQRLRPRCLIYVPNEDDISSLRKNTSLQFNDTLNMKWSKWHPLVITDNPRIAGNGLTSISFIPPRDKYWRKNDPTLFSYDVLKLRVKKIEDHNHLVYDMPSSLSVYLQRWNGLPVPFVEHLTKLGIYIPNDFSFLASPILTRRKLKHKVVRISTEE